jgi:secreted trypsin-like serine protease
MPNAASEWFLVLCLSGLVTLLAVDCEAHGTQPGECTASSGQAIIGGSADASSVAAISVAASVAAVVVESDAGHPSLCSGVLVADRFVLSAAHCASGIAPSSLQVWFGLSAPPFAGVNDCRQPTTYPVVALERDTEADVMLVELASSVSPSIPVVGVAQSSPLVGQMGVIAGYGLNGQGTAGDRLFVGTTVVGIGVTATGYSSPDGEADAGTCAGDADVDAPSCSGGRLLITVDSGADAGACAGDSGGPLFVRDASGWRVAGVLSEGSASCTGEDVFVDLASITGWITSHITG